MFRNDRDAEADAAGRSIYERVLGERFAALDPRLRTYFGPIPEGFVGVGHGEFAEAGLRVRFLRPVFALLGRWEIAFPERGRQVPFTIRNTPGRGGSLHGVRTFFFPGSTREMRDWMRVAGERLVDRMGTRGRIEVELEVRTTEGELIMMSRRIALRIAGRRMPLPPVVRLLIRERALDEAQHVDVRMTAPLLREIYGYRGTFTYTVQPVAGPR